MVHLLEANIAMGLDHQWSVPGIITSAGAFFLTKNPEFFRKHAEVQSYCRYIEAQSPDIAFLTEVCWEDQKNDICNFLESKWYHIHFMRAFELYNMDSESHRFLYNIIAARSSILAHNEFQSRIQNDSAEKVYSFSRIYNELGKPERGPYVIQKMKKFTGGILDGGGAHCEIEGIHYWLLHTHPTSSSIITSLRDSLPKEKQGILWWDFNVSQETWKALVGDRFSYISPEKRTFPYYGTHGGVFSRAIDTLAKNTSKILSHPDQFYSNHSIARTHIQALWPKETGLGSDHAVTHIHIAT